MARARRRPHPPSPLRQSKLTARWHYPQLDHSQRPRPDHKYVTTPRPACTQYTHTLSTIGVPILIHRRCVSCDAGACLLCFSCPQAIQRGFSAIFTTVSLCYPQLIHRRRLCWIGNIFSARSDEHTSEL